MTKDEMVGWHHRLNGHKFEQAPGVGDGQGSLATAVHGQTWNPTGVGEQTARSGLQPLGVGEAPAKGAGAAERKGGS